MKKFNIMITYCFGALGISSTLIKLNSDFHEFKFEERNFAGM